MPNWCSNRWEIYAEDETQAQEVYDLMTTDEGNVTFDKILPMPEVLKRTGSGFAKIDGEDVSTWIEDVDAEGKQVNRHPTPEEREQIAAAGASNWYDWAVGNWGTKWNATDSETSIEGDAVYLSFSTAWAPPEPVLAALRERFPDAEVSAFYDEPGMQVAGYL